MTELLQQILNGLAIGMVYGSIALALAVVLEATGVLNFAQGEMAVVSAFVCWQLSDWGLGFWLSFLITITFSVIMGMAIERVLVRPIEHATHLQMLIVTLAIFLGLNSLIGMIWGYLPKQTPAPFGDGVHTIGGAVLTSQQIGMAAILCIALAACAAFFRFTDAGLRLRAAAQNPASTRLVGVNVNRQLMFGWGLAAAVGGIAGVMAAPVIGLHPDMMSSTILLAFTALALGGFESKVGAILGGLLVGVVTSLGRTYIPGIGTNLSLAIPFALILVVLLVRPQGLLGRASNVRF